MSKQNEQLGLTKTKNAYHFRVRKGDTFLDRVARPYLDPIEPGLFVVRDDSFETLEELKQATQAYKQITQAQQQYDQALQNWDALVAKSGNDNILPPSEIQPTFGDRYSHAEPEGFDLWQEKNQAWRKLSATIASRRNADRLLEPLKIYFELKK